MSAFATPIQPSAAVLLAVAADPNGCSGGDGLREALLRVTDWRQVTDLALDQQLSGLLYRSVSTLCPECVPASVLARWKARSFALRARSLRMERQLVSLSERFTAAGVPMLAYKGPVLAATVYGDSGVRHFIDLDVMVRSEHVDRARQLAMQAGFVDLRPYDEALYAAVLVHQQEIELTMPVQGVHLEIHWRTGPRFADYSLTAEQLLARASTVALLGVPIACPGLPEMLLTLVQHAVKHDWNRLEDVAALNAGLQRLPKGGGLELLALARQTGCLRRLHVGVLVARELRGEWATPEVAAAAAKDRGARRLARGVAVRLMKRIGESEPDAERLALAPFRRAVRESEMLDSIAARGHHLWRRAATPNLEDFAMAARTCAAGSLTYRAQMQRARRLWRVYSNRGDKQRGG